MIQDDSWSTDRISPAGREKLREAGFAPPAPRAGGRDDARPAAVEGVPLPLLRLDRDAAREHLRPDAVPLAPLVRELPPAVRAVQDDLAGRFFPLDPPATGECILAFMLSIGRFADATGLTVKALRHYDEIGLLAPAHVDPDNGYRYYEAAQIEDAVTIRRLRALELPIDEVKELVRADSTELRDRLAAHGYRVAEEVREKHSLLIELSALVEGGDDQLDVAVVDVPELRLAGTIRHLRVVDPDGVAEMLHAARTRLTELGIEPIGPATALFRSGDQDGTHLVEAGFPVGPEVEGDTLLHVRVYPAASAAVVEHVGSYSGLHLTAQRFIATVLGQGMRVTQPIRIEYTRFDALARVIWPVG